MIYSAGSVVEHEDGTVSEEVDDGTPILLFCRNLGVVRFPVCFFSFRIHLSIVSLTFFLWALNNCVYNVVIAGLRVLRQAVLHGARTRKARRPATLPAVWPCPLSSGSRPCASTSFLAVAQALLRLWLARVLQLCSSSCHRHQLYCEGVP